MYRKWKISRVNLFVFLYFPVDWFMISRMNKLSRTLRFMQDSVRQKKLTTNRVYRVEKIYSSMLLKLWDVNAVCALFHCVFNVRSIYAVNGADLVSFSHSPVALYKYIHQTKYIPRNSSVRRIVSILET